MRTTRTDPLERIDTSGGPTACHPWMGAVNATGYGRVKHDGRSMDTHVVVYLLTRGPIPKGHLVRHMCVDRSTRRIDGTAMGDRRCCNRVHLETGTQRENALDRERAARTTARRSRPLPPGRHW